MRMRILILLLLCFQAKEACSQAGHPAPRNYPGIYSSLVFNDISAAFGLEYERYLLVRSKFAWAARAGYLFKYKWGNANFITGTKDDISSVNWQLWTSGYWYTTAGQQPDGFFINSGMGLNYTKSEQRVMLNPPDYTTLKGNGLSPAIEAGVGFQFKITNGTVIRIGSSGAIYFPKAEDKSFSPKNTLSLRISAGF